MKRAIVLVVICLVGALMTAGCEFDWKREAARSEQIRKQFENVRDVLAAMSRDGLLSREQVRRLNEDVFPAIERANRTYVALIELAKTVSSWPDGSDKEAKLREIRRDIDAVLGELIGLASDLVDLVRERRDSSRATRPVVDWRDELLAARRAIE